jgi:cell division protein FtsI/penicillin-binding protein 2
VLVLLAIVAAGFMSLAAGFPWAIAAVERWNEAHVIQRTGDVSGMLFDRLVEDREIVFDAASGKLDLRIDCDLERAGFGKSGAEHRKLVNRLCDSDPGNAIQNEVKVWNRNLSILAIRDNHRSETPNSDDCDNGKSVALIIPEGCFPAIWELALQADDADRTFDARLRESPSAEVHGYLARPIRSGFGDWTQFDTAAVGPGDVLLQARFPAANSDRTITVDLIGEFKSAQIDGRNADIGRRLHCHGSLDPDRCRRIVAQDPRVPHAWRLQIPLVRDRVARVVLRVRPAPVVPLVLSGLGTLEEDRRPIVRNARFRPDETVRLTTNIALACQVVSPDEFASGNVVRYVGRRAASGASDTKRFCEPAWNTSQIGQRARFGAVQINAAGGEKPLSLTQVQRPVAGTREDAKAEPADVEVLPTTDTVRLGLLPVIGLGAADRYSLLGQAVRRARPGDKPPELNLTIDPELQSIAYQRLSDVVSRKPGTEALTAGFASGKDADRRAAVVLLDAGLARGGDNGGGYDADAGRILAAATWPQLPPKPAHMWDTLASDNYRPTGSALAARAWSQNDKHYQPGSTFKPLIALAAIERAARGETAFLRALGLGRGQNGLLEQEIPTVFGRRYNFSYRSTALEVSIGDDEQTTHEISNFAGVALCHLVNGTPACPRDGRIGLRGAITTSNNMFFARLALLVDEDRVMRRTPNGRMVEIKETDAANPAQPLVIERIAKRLVPAKPFDLAPGFTERFGSPPIAGSRTYATPVIIDAGRSDRPRRLSLALAGIGQAVQATPLAMATIMASIAAGKIVRPRITIEATAPRPPTEGNEEQAVAGDDLLDLNAKQGTEEPIRQEAVIELMSGLRGALHNVVVNGTARTAFARSLLQARVYGKTGTAETGDDEASTNSVWFIGWIDGLGQRRWRGRRIAFACLVTHTERDESAGGRVCAPLIEQILAEYERAPGPTAATLEIRQP